MSKGKNLYGAKKKKNLPVVGQVLRVALINFWMIGWVVLWRRMLLAGDEVIQPPNVHFTYKSSSLSAPPLCMIQTGNRNATITLLQYFLCSFICSCQCLLLFLFWWLIPNDVVWNGSLHETGPVSVSGDTTAEGTEEEVGSVKIPTTSFTQKPASRGSLLDRIPKLRLKAVNEIYIENIIVKIIWPF